MTDSGNNLLAFLSLGVSAVIGLTTLWITARRDKRDDENADQARTSVNQQANATQLASIGDLAVQIATKVIDKSDDDRDRYDAELELLRYHVEVCERKLAVVEELARRAGIQMPGEDHIPSAAEIEIAAPPEDEAVV